jgi:SRSO17 transposase
VDSQDRAVAVGASVDIDGWREHFDTAFSRIAGRFGRVEPRRQARSFLLGVLSDVDSRSCWQLAEHAGDSSPHAMQRLLSEAVWDVDQVRDDLRRYVADELGEPDGVLVLDDTGDLKKGTASVGVQRQYTGTAGRIENGHPPRIVYGSGTSWHLRSAKPGDSSDRVGTTAARRSRMSRVLVATLAGASRNTRTCRTIGT